MDLGWIAASFGGVSLLTALAAGMWSQGMSERLAVVFGGVAITLGCATLFGAQSLVLILVGQSALASGETLILVANQSILAKATNAGDEGDGGFGHYLAAASLGQLIGPPLAAYLAAHAATEAPVSTSRATAGGSTLPFLFATIPSIAVSLVALGLPRSGTARAIVGMASAPSMGQVLQLPVMPLAVLCSLLMTSCLDLMQTYVPAIAYERGWSVEVVGLLLAVRAVASLLARVVSARLVSAWGRWRVLVLSSVFPAVTLLALPLIGSAELTLVAVGILGFALGLGVPITLDWIGRIAPMDSKASAISLRLAGNRLGQVLLPLGGAALAGALGLGTIFPAMGGSLGVITVLLLSARALIGRPHQAS